MINENESEAENKKQITQIKHRLGHKYMKYEMSQYNDMVMCINQHQSNI